MLLYFPAEIARIAQQLKLQHSSDLESSVPLWDRLKDPKDTNVDVFLNQNIFFEDDEGPLKSAISSFEQIFENSMYKRVIISGHEGYGKTTMILDLVKQWVMGYNGKREELKWVKNFSFVFHFRLELIERKQVETLESFILSQQLTEKETKLICHWIRSKTNVHKIMFIFDGVHEFRHSFCDEINDILLGTSTFCPFVVIATKPGDERYKSNSCLRIKLHGLKEYIIQQQLISVINSGTAHSGFDLSMIHMLKVPLYYTLYQICVKESSGTQTFNVSTLIERYLKLLGRRHRKSNLLFSDLQEQELSLLLGQIAQAQYSMIDIMPNVEKLRLTSKYLNIAKSIGYIQENSSQEKIIFSHRALADYFAALFWVRKKPVTVRDVPYLQMVEFMEPRHGLCTSLGLFSCILSNYNKSYKQYLWHQFTEYVPLLNDYNDLPLKIVDCTVLRFPDISSQTTGLIMDNIEFDLVSPSTAVLTMVGVNFEGGRKFANLYKFRKFSLMNCSMKISPWEFFMNYNLKQLDLNQCTFQDELLFDRNERREARFKLHLQDLQVDSPTGGISNWLRYVMEESKNLQNLDLSNLAEVDDSWVSAMQNNAALLKSMQKVSLSFSTPVKVANILQAITSMPNLTDLNLTGCYMMMNEIDILAQYFQNGARKLKYLCLEEDENIGKSVQLWKSLGRLNNLTELQITDCKLSIDCLYTLRKVFRYNLNNLEKCTFVKENVITNNSDILTVINMCRNIRLIIFDRCQLLDSELVLAKDLLSNFKFDSQTVVRNGRMETTVQFYK